MIEAIVLAAGYASRMKTNKMLLEIGHKPMILHTVERIAPFVEKIYVVTGHYHESIQSVFATNKQVEVIYNSQYSDGMFSSIKTALPLIKHHMLIIPGDMPFISATTYERILNQPGMIRVPMYQGKKGHPIYIDSCLKESLIESNLPHLKAFRDMHKVTYFEVDDAAILKDIDTIEDYQSIERINQS